MESIFISSLARGEMGAIRQGAKTAVESLGMRPVMFETTGASDQNSRRLLLDRISQCDALLLLLGAQYGEPGQRGVSPTEEEFDEAQRAGVPVLPLVQEGVEREPDQQAFVARVRGTWESGRFAPSFTDASDVVPAVVRALNDWRSAAPSAEQARAAGERVQTFARGPERDGEMQSGSKLRVVAVPLTSRPLLDAVALSDPDALVDDLIGAARSSRLITNAMAVTHIVHSDDTIRLQAKAERAWEQLNLVIGADGAVVGEGAVSGAGQLGGMVVMHDRVAEVIERSLAFAEAVWQRIDTRDEVQQVLLAVAVPGADHKTYTMTEPGSSLSGGGLFGMPHVLIAPETALAARRQDLGRPETRERLRAELRRRFDAARAPRRG